MYQDIHHRPNTSARRPARQTVDSTRGWSRFWAVALGVSTLAVGLVAVLGAPDIIRTPIILWFIAICPGMAIVRLLRLDQPIPELMLALAIGLALDGLIPATFLYLGAWSPAWSLTTLVAIAGTAWLLGVAISYRRSRVSVQAHGGPATFDLIRLVHGSLPRSRSPRSTMHGQAFGSEELALSASTLSLASVMDLLIDDLDERRKRDN